MKPQYLRIRNWERFQHYKDRRPPWIKYHVELLDDYELTHLDYATQLLYDRLLLLAARTDNNIPNDPEHIGSQVHIDKDVVAKSLEKLLFAGFLVVAERKRAASKAIARRKQSAMPETEAETEAETNSEKNVVDLAGVQTIYGHWRAARGKTHGRYATMTSARRKKIQARLKEFSVEDLVQALDNVALDDWSERAKHDDITVLFKSRESVERWLNMGEMRRASGDEFRAYDF